MRYLWAAHLTRWALELLFIWTLILPETGVWTALCFTLITVGLEFNYLKQQELI